MKVLDNKTKYDISDVLKLAKRDNNKKRNYLFVNPMQAKHIPVSPDKCLLLFNHLSQLVYNTYKDERIFIIGFAETATAIGVSVASAFGNVFYCHTTRENINTVKNIAIFEEEHSHAVEQMLFCNNPEETILKSDRIIFVEDEITTGKTILNFIKVLKSNGYINQNHRISVASIINSMNQENYNLFESMGIDCKYLFKIEHNQNEDLFIDSDIVNQYENVVLPSKVSYTTFCGKIDPRICVNIMEYNTACKQFIDDILSGYMDLEFDNKNILVLGTEEFMYPAILLGNELLKYNIKSVKTHSTTRSPIEAHNTDNYPIKTKVKLKSFYSKDRETFLYNLNSYDKVIVVTDTENNSFMNGAKSLIEHLYNYNCKDIDIFRWVK